MFKYCIVKNLGSKKHWRICELNPIRQSSFAGYACDHAVCGMHVWYLKQAT